jgi:hypothetical protein
MAEYSLHDLLGMVTTVPQRCKSCRFVRAWDSKVRGDCRRFPPTVVVLSSDIRTVYPTVDLNGWCGEYRQSMIAEAAE